MANWHPFTIVAWVVLPDHLHAVWTLPEGDTDYATRWGLIKAGFSRRIPKAERIRASRALKGERGVWQRRFWEHLIRDDRDLAQHVDYIHYNPVKHGYVDRAVDWPYSPFHRELRRGHVTADWGVRDGAMGDFGDAAYDRAGGVGVRASPQPTQAEAVQADRLFGKKDMQTGDIAFQPAQARLDLADVLAALALGVEHFLHHLHQQIQAGIRHLRPPLLRCAFRLYGRGEPSTSFDPPGKQASL